MLLLCEANVPVTYLQTPKASADYTELAPFEFRCESRRSVSRDSVTVVDDFIYRILSNASANCNAFDQACL